LEGESEVLHIELQTDPTKVMPMRLADYRLRIHRKAPDKTIHQVVIYLRQTNSEQVYQEYFEIAGMYAEYRVIRIWEVPIAQLMQYSGLLPFAALGQTDNPEQVLRDSVQAMSQLPASNQQHEVLGAAYLLSGLVLDQAMIGKIIRRDVMRESVTYQAVLDEGREEGLQLGIKEGRQVGIEEARRSIVINLLREGASIDLIAKASGMSIDEINQLQDSL
ncbi:Rpn family recombination-promoting nuclease/putative transposase, partial [filamentous cyanobacterium LEGE 11480]